MGQGANIRSGYMLLTKLCVGNWLPGRKKSPHVSHMGLMAVGFALEQASREVRDEIDVITVLSV